MTSRRLLKRFTHIISTSASGRKGMLTNKFYRAKVVMPGNVTDVRILRCAAYLKLIVIFIIHLEMIFSCIFQTKYWHVYPIIERAV